MLTFTLDSIPSLSQDDSQIIIDVVAATRLLLEVLYQSSKSKYPTAEDFLADLEKFVNFSREAGREMESRISRERQIVLLSQCQEQSAQIRTKYRDLLDSEEMKRFQDFEYGLEGFKRLTISYQHLLQSLDSKASANPITIMHTGMVELSKAVEQYISTFSQQTIQSIRTTALSVLELMQSKPEELSLPQDLLDKFVSLKDIARSILWQLDNYKNRRWTVANITPAPNDLTAIIRTERGLTIAGTRITLYDVMDYVMAQYPPQFIQGLFDLTEEQINSALAYIEAHRVEVETEYQQVLKEAEELRQYYEEQNRERFARSAAKSPKPGTEAAWEKLRAAKAKYEPK